jgi:hypothetical protein
MDVHMTGRHLRSAIPSFGIPKGLPAALFRSLQAHCLREGMTERSFEQLTDWWTKNYEGKGPIKDMDALFYHIAETFGKDVAEVCSEWHATVSTESGTPNPDAIEPMSVDDFESETEQAQKIYEMNGQTPHEVSRTHQQRLLEIEQRAHRQEQAEERERLASFNNEVNEAFGEHGLNKLIFELEQKMKDWPAWCADKVAQRHYAEAIEARDRLAESAAGREMLEDHDVQFQNDVPWTEKDKFDHATKLGLVSAVKDGRPTIVYRDGDLSDEAQLGGDDDVA